MIALQTAASMVTARHFAGFVTDLPLLVQARHVQLLHPNLERSRRSVRLQIGIGDGSSVIDLFAIPHYLS